MRVVFRADASLQMGTGHIMRCLTLADALRKNGAHCLFICREHSGNALDMIRRFGFETVGLALGNAGADISETAADCQTSNRATWLGVNWEVDAEQTRAAFSGARPDWLVVDHYAIGAQWEQSLRDDCCKLMVIDDLADRMHDCDLLLDQNLGRHEKDYGTLIPESCKVLAGSNYAMLRRKFPELRAYSLRRRQLPTIERVLISMGGVDQCDATSQVLKVLKESKLLMKGCRLQVIMGLQAPWLRRVVVQAERMPWPAEVVVNADDMARRMADSDLAIGAAGTTSWERCCLGLPTLIVALADNQLPSAKALHATRAALLIGGVADIEVQLPLALREATDSDFLARMSVAASAVTDGLGVGRVLQAMAAIDE